MERVRNFVGILIGICCVCILACCARKALEKSEDPDRTEISEAEPLVIEIRDITETEAFQDAVSEKVQDIFSGDISLTVYAEGIEAFSYKGKAELVHDGSDGAEPVLVIYATGRAMEDDWF